MGYSGMRIWLPGRLLLQRYASRSFGSSAVRVKDLTETPKAGVPEKEYEVKEKIHNRLSILSGAPEEHLNRHVKIYRPARATTQQGKGTKVMMWHLKFTKKDGVADRWTNPLMGWTSTGDPLTNLDVSFPTVDQAVDFAKRNGYSYTVEDRNHEKENVRKFTAFGRSMVHQWRHDQIPVYEKD